MVRVQTPTDNRVDHRESSSAPPTVVPGVAVPLPVTAASNPSGGGGEQLTRARVRELLAAYSDHPSNGLVLNAGTQYFTQDPIAGLVAYRRAGHYLFQLGGVFAPEPNRTPLLRAFLDFSGGRGLRVCGVQLRDHDVDLYHRQGFRLNQMGLSYTLDLAGFNTRGAKFMKLRNKVARASRAGIEVRELGREQALTPEIRQNFDRITWAWVRAKGRHKKLCEFLVGEIDAIQEDGTRCFLALCENRVIAFITYVPSYGRLCGLMHDLSRRQPDSPPGVMELINLTAIQRFQAEGVRHLNFGLTPFAGVADQLGSHSPLVARVVALLSRYGSVLYPASSQAAYKLKWDPQIIEPEYFAFQGRFRLDCLWQLLRLTRSI